MIRIDWSTGLLQPRTEVLESVKTLGQLDGLFADAAAWCSMDSKTVVYRVQAWCPIADGAEGGLFWGNTVIEPGQVGSEYFMTHGHFHRKRDRAEYYATISGEGALILMDENRKTWMERMHPGSLHFIPPCIGHRTVNTGNVPLHFVACWPSDAGHDYDLIRQKGFGARLLNVDGSAKLVAEAA
jgi:glucose-6-phosphate isomerase